MFSNNTFRITILSHSSRRLELFIVIGAGLGGSAFICVIFSLRLPDVGFNYSVVKEGKVALQLFEYFYPKRIGIA